MGTREFFQKVFLLGVTLFAYKEYLFLHCVRFFLTRLKNYIECFECKEDHSTFVHYFNSRSTSSNGSSINKKLNKILYILFCVMVLQSFELHTEFNLKKKTSQMSVGSQCKSNIWNSKRANMRHNLKNVVNFFSLSLTLIYSFINV